MEPVLSLTTRFFAALRMTYEGLRVTKRRVQDDMKVFLRRRQSLNELKTSLNSRSPGEPTSFNLFQVCVIVLTD